MLDLAQLVHVVLTLIVAGLICWLLIFLIDYCGIPEPFNKVARVVVMVVAVLVIIGVLVSLVQGVPLFR